MRVLLAILVCAVQVAGPWLCCCLTDRLAGASTRSAEQPPPTLEPTCPHCKKPAEPPTDRPSVPIPHQCPCGGKALLAISPPPPITDAGSQAVSWTDPLFVAVSVACQSATVVVTTVVSELPFLPTETRLFVHHALRC